MKELQYQDVRQMLLRCAQRIFRCEPYLTKADSAIGDGDHGNGMVNGMLAARKVLEKDRPDNDIYALYAEMAEAMQRRMGGAYPLSQEHFTVFFTDYTPFDRTVSLRAAPAFPSVIP